MTEFESSVADALLAIVDWNIERGPKLPGDPQNDVRYSAGVVLMFGGE